MDGVDPFPPEPRRSCTCVLSFSLPNYSRLGSPLVKGDSELSTVSKTTLLAGRVVHLPIHLSVYQIFIKLSSHGKGVS